MPESNWKYRAIIVAPLADCPGINSAVAANLDEAGGNVTLTVELVATATGVVTHRWCNSKLTRTGAHGDSVAAKSGLLQLAAVFPDARGYIWCEPENAELLAELSAAYSAIQNVAVGEVGADDVLSELGLSRITVEE